MKSLIIAIIIGTATVLGSVGYTNHLEKISADMVDKNNDIRNDIMSHNYSSAANKTREFSEYVREKRTILDAVGNHQELDEIERNLSELAAFAEDEMHGDAISKCYSLDFLLRALPRNFKIKIENIL